MECFFSTTDWTRIRDKNCNLTFEELAHCSHLKLDPSTIETAKTLFSAFDIPEDTKKRLAAAWQVQLKEHIVKNSAHGILRGLVHSEFGSFCLGLCAAINHYYSKDAITVVLEKLGRMAAMPTDLALSLTAWGQFAHACERLRLPPDFQNLVDKYTSLGRYGDEKAEDVAARNFGMQLEHIGPHRLLEILQTMSTLRDRQEESCPLCLMGSDAGWMAAVAHWFFQLKINIQGVDGNILYSNSDDSDRPTDQMTFAFQNRGRPAEGSELEDPPLHVKETEDEVELYKIFNP